MAILDIRIYPDEVLREVCLPVENITDEIRTLLDNMAETMYDAPGIGLAAPQVGSTHRVIVLDVGDDPENEQSSRLYKIINPEIVDSHGKTKTEEGCLSIPEMRELVPRAAEVHVKGLDPDGNPLSIEADGLLAICLQHEIDHLNGVLFIDHLSRLKRDLLKAKYKKFLKSLEE